MWERCARCVAGHHDQHHLHHHVLRVRPRPCTLSSSIGLTECHVSFRLCTFVCLQSLTLSHKLSLTRSLGPQRHSTRTLLPCRDVLVEKHYRSVLGRGVLDPFFAAHTKVCTFTCSLPTRLVLPGTQFEPTTSFVPHLLRFPLSLDSVTIFVESSCCESV